MMVHKMWILIPWAPLVVAWGNLGDISVNLGAVSGVQLVNADLAIQFRTMYPYIVRIQFLGTWGIEAFETPLMKSSASYKKGIERCSFLKKEIWLITCGKSFRIVDDFFTLRTRFGLHDDSEVSNSCLNKTVQAERMSLTEPWISRLGQGKMNSRPAAGAEGIRRRRAWARGWR